MVTHSPSTSDIRVQFIYLDFNIDLYATSPITMGSLVGSRKIHVADRFLTSVKGKYKIRISNKLTIEYIFENKLFKSLLLIKNLLDYIDN